MASNKITSWEKLNFASRDERRLRMSEQESKRRKNEFNLSLTRDETTLVCAIFLSPSGHKLPAIIKSSLKYPCYTRRKTVVKCQVSRWLEGCRFTGNIEKKNNLWSSWEKWTKTEERRCRGIKMSKVETAWPAT